MGYYCLREKFSQKILHFGVPRHRRFACFLGHLATCKLANGVHTTGPYLYEFLGKISP
jgi:hypothetical protein